MQNNYNFCEFDETIISYFHFSEDFVLPLKVDISDIQIKESKVRFLKAKKENNTLMVDMTNSPYKHEYEYVKFKSEILEYLDYVDCESKLFDKSKHNLLEHLELTSKAQLLDFLIEVVEVPMSSFIELRNEIEGYKSVLMGNFMERLKEFMAYNDNLPTWKPDTKGINPSNYDTSFTQTYIKTQSIVEYGSGIIFFKENIGKSLSEFSWRELQLRLMFLNRKSQVDSEQNRMQNDMYKTIETKN